MLERWVLGSNTDGLCVKSCTVSLIQPTDNHRPWIVEALETKPQERANISPLPVVQQVE